MLVRRLPRLLALFCSSSSRGLAAMPEHSDTFDLTAEQVVHQYQRLNEFVLILLREFRRVFWLSLLWPFLVS